MKTKINHLIIFSMILLMTLGARNQAQAYDHSCFRKGKVKGAILQKYNQLGACKSFLKAPKTSELTTPDKIGRFNHFVGGSIYWSPKTGAHEVHGAIRDKWSSMGWERSFLGYPISDELKGANGKRYSKFQGGIIYWTKAKGTWLVRSGSSSGGGSNNNCKSANTSAVIVALNQALYNTQIRLDKDNSFVSFTGTYTYKFKIPAQKITKGGYDWNYYAKDIKSTQVKLSQAGNLFKLNVKFEGDGSEIKGVRFNGPKSTRDKRVPDINWQGNRSIDIYFKPIAYNNSLSLVATKVNVNGKFEINGRVDDVCKKIGDKIERRIKSEIQKAATASFVNNTTVKRKIADTIRPYLKRLRIPNFKSVRISGSKMLFCK